MDEADERPRLEAVSVKSQNDRHYCGLPYNDPTQKRRDRFLLALRLFLLVFIFGFFRMTFNTSTCSKSVEANGMASGPQPKECAFHI